MTDIFIIGAGPAGITAGIYAVRAGYSAVLLESGFSGGQMATTPEVDNFPGLPGMNGADLAMKMEAHARAAGVVFLTGEAVSLDLSGDIKRIRTSNDVFEARSLILAMGASRRRLGCPGEDEFAGRGVSYCATCDGGFFKGKKTAVIGGGNSALEDALYLSQICDTVYLIHRRSEFRGGHVLEQRVRKTPNIELVLDCTVEKIYGEMSVSGITVKNLKTEGSQNIAVSGVFCAIGTVPNTSLVKDMIELDSGGFITAGEDCKTNIPGVFAAGDIRRKPLRQIVTAAADGANAANSAQEYLK